MELKHDDVDKDVIVNPKTIDSLRWSFTDKRL